MWDACLAVADPVVLSGTVLRFVESQEQVATTSLCSSLARQALLEDLLEETKPALRPQSAGLHYLLATPFRYPPLKHGSRFGRRTEPALFYGSMQTRTVLAEAAYYRFVFWHGMARPPPGRMNTQHTLFGARYRGKRGLRLQDPPFSAHIDVLTHPADYAQTQALGSKMREAGIDAFQFVSARDPQGGINVALFTPLALAGTAPVSQETWLCETTGTRTAFRPAHAGDVHAFELDGFLVSGSLPCPAC